MAKVNKGIFIISNRETVAELCRNYLNNTAPNRIKPVTLQSYRQMLDQQLAVEIASSGDFGIADALVRQLGGPEAASGPRVADDPLAAAGRLRVDLAAGRWAGPSADPSAEKAP